MRHVVVGTAGHIDHGKSRLVRALTGIDPDRLQEEKARGITIDLGFAHLVRGDTTFALVDVPGHERFVRTMLAGAGGIDAVLIVVAADEGVMPQTREHFEICRLLGIRHGVIALTKCDVVDAEMQALAAHDVAELVAGSAFEQAAVVPVSAHTGAGIDRLLDALDAVAASVGPRPADGPVRLPLDRAFTVRGFGTVVTGTLVSGRIREGVALGLLPAGETVRVRALQVHGARVAEARAGQRVAVNLAGIEVERVARGQTLAEPGTLGATRRVDVELQLLPSARALKHGARVRVHQGTGWAIARVSLMLSAGAALEPGRATSARLRLEAPLALTRGDRLVLRAYSPPVTIGGALVLDPEPPRGGIRTSTAPARFAALAFPADPAASDDEAIAAMVRDGGRGGLDITRLTARAGIAPADVSGLVDRLVRGGRVEAIGGALFEPSLRAALGTALERLVRDFHEQQPLAEGLPREQARDRLFRRAPAALFERVVADLVDRGAISARDRLAAAGRQVTLNDEESRAREAILTELEAAGLSPPDAAAIGQHDGVPAAVASRVVTLLARQRAIVRLDGLYFDVKALETLKAEVRELKRRDGHATLDVAAFKQRFGLTRKYAIPLLEYLDRERVTRRVGDVRVVL